MSVRQNRTIAVRICKILGMDSKDRGGCHGLVCLVICGPITLLCVIAPGRALLLFAEPWRVISQRVERLVLTSRTTVNQCHSRIPHVKSQFAMADSAKPAQVSETAVPPTQVWPPPHMKQHRCHPRLADVAHTVLTLKGSEFPRRVQLWYQCVRSEVGAEPQDTFLVDPAEQAIRAKNPMNPFDPLAKPASTTGTGTSNAKGSETK